MADVLNKARPTGRQKDHREFCWKYLWNIARQDRDFSIGKFSIRRLALSGNGRILAGICTDRAVRAWDVETGEVLCSQADFLYEPCSVAVSYDGKLIATTAPGPCEWCGEARVWETETNRLLRELRGVGVSEGGICFLPETKTLVLPLRRLLFDPQSPKYLPMRSGVLLLWDFETGSERVLCEGQSRATAVTVSSDGTTLAVSCQERPESQLSIHLISTADLAKRDVIRSGMDSIDSLDFSLDGAAIAANARGKTPHLWNAATGAAISPSEPQMSAIRDAVFFGEDHTLLTFVESNASTHLQFVTSGQSSQISSLPHAPGDRIIGAARSLNGKTVAWWGTGSTIHLRRPIPTPAHRRFSLPFRETIRLTFSATGSLQIVGRDEQELLVWQENGSIRKASALELGDAGRTTLIVSPDGARMVTWNDGNTISLWNLPDGSILQHLTEETAASDLLAFSDDCKTLAHAHKDGQIIVRNLDDGVVQSMFVNPSAPNQAMALSPDGRLLVTTGARGEIDLWHTEGGNLLSRYFDTPVASQILFTPDGRFVISICKEGVPRIWGVFSESRREFLGGHHRTAAAVAISPDSRTMATASNDQSVRLWHVATGNQLLSFDRLGDDVKHLTFSRDGVQLAAVLANGEAILWDCNVGNDQMTVLAPVGSKNSAEGVRDQRD